MKNRSMFFRLLIVVPIALSIITACSKSSNNNPAPGANEVFIQSYAFTPSTITVPVNTTITWTNKDAVSHTVTSTSGLFDSGTLGTNGTYSHLFSAAGTYPYLCTIHPYMTATVIVQ